jgi:phosphomannomutase
MRVLINRHQKRQVDKVDGLKVHLDNGEWVHLSPSPDKPRFEVLAEGQSQVRAQALADEYRQMVEEILLQADQVVGLKKDE